MMLIAYLPKKIISYAAGCLLNIAGVISPIVAVNCMFVQRYILHSGYPVGDECFLIVGVLTNVVIDISGGQRQPKLLP
jgi:hypothetical protein